ncbi:ejaculatory bulb-specific protein 3-like [Achroia grisella]|uniref:ejaculatory bulb-specific protein 3-like n=1 Tax=Achroia grisella TaxID=688607 RepID=UPI0027D33892|nr:ejaculatory bulb-specific protein 3-like [Achroia grisella]XP_059060890.1 ejaculatory bulb-specific protein 3-like [Achroia grisella]XP_059060891.1 ejaculatory bulb-specific protein 3-like [Achroia grisella]
MEVITVLCAVIALVAADEKYSATNDHFDVEALVASKAELETFTSCFISNVNCNDISNDFKKDIPEAVKEACGKCTNEQKHIFKRYLEGLQEQLPQRYEDFKKKYDPEGKLLEPLRVAISNS